MSRSRSGLSLLSLVVLTACHTGGDSHDDEREVWQRYPSLASRAPRDLDGEPTAHVALPAHAAGDVRLEAGSLALRFALRGARAVPLRRSGREAIYPGAFEGADILYRVDQNGVEDYVAFAARPAVERLTYVLDVRGIAGLRLVGDVLELVDAGGIPRIRAAHPDVVDAKGVRSAAHFAVEGCAYDADASAPWTRPPTKPGSTSCLVHLSWSAASYPAIVDPYWTSTGVMTTRRQLHEAALLTSGDVLVAAGVQDRTDPTTSADLFTPTANAFAATGSLGAPRPRPRAVRVPSGKVLFVGGGDETTTLATSELFDPATGTFTASGSMAEPRRAHSATLLPNGKVLVAGGMSAAPYATAELYDPTAGTFASTGVMTVARAGHVAVLLKTGKVFIAGGGASTAELYDPATGAFSPIGSMLTARSAMCAALLGSGKVLLVGGSEPAAISTAEIFDPATLKFTIAPVPTVSHVECLAVTLSSGNAVIVGGSYGTPPNFSPSAEVFKEAGAKFEILPNLSRGRARHSLTVLASGRVLAAGGVESSAAGAAFMNAEVLTIDPAGAKCTTGDDCESGQCTDGVCCDSACTGQCVRAARAPSFRT